MNKCNILFPRDSEPWLKDEDGCILPEGNHEVHLFHNYFDNKKVQWEYDLECNCGCMDSDTFNDVCIIYNEI